MTQRKESDDLIHRIDLRMLVGIIFFVFASGGVWGVLHWRVNNIEAQVEKVSSSTGSDHDSIVTIQADVKHIREQIARQEDILRDIQQKVNV